MICVYGHWSLSSSGSLAVPGRLMQHRFAAADFEVGLAAESDLGVHKNSLVRGLQESLQWWLVTRPEVSLRHTSIHATSRSSAAQSHDRGLGDTCRP